ncbi:MAG: hypothetical protein LBQ86_03345, partial [Holophagales bacterium]|nr:hypothetical protein [Holophagales bacterium]
MRKQLCNHFKLIAVMLAISLGFVSCGGGNNGEKPVPTPVVYVAGFTSPPPTQLWVNGVPQSLSLSDGITDAHANSVFVSGNDMYVAGNEHDDGLRDYATLWVNGVRQRLSDSYGSFANSVFVSGGNVYVAGNEDDGYHYYA